MEQLINELDMQKLYTTKNRFDLVDTEEAKAVDLINNSLMTGAINYFCTNKFIYMPVPIMTKITGACENVDTLYSIDHFGQEAFLAQTGQLYLEAKIPLHKKLWTVITSSRAETEADSRHLNQFNLLEMEFQGDFEDLITNVEGCVKSMLNHTLGDNSEVLHKLGRYDEIIAWSRSLFGRLTYTEAIEQLKGTPFEIEWGRDLEGRHEAYLVEENGNKPLFITHYPKAIKFFNMKENEKDSRVVNSTDLLMPYSGESAGCAERENNFDKLVNRLKNSDMFKVLSKRGVKLEQFQDYLDMVQRHPILHSGCGIGFERITQSVLGAKDIRASTSFPIQSDVLY